MSSIPSVTPTHGARVEFVVQPKHIALITMGGASGRSYDPSVIVTLSKDAQTAMKNISSHTVPLGDNRNGRTKIPSPHLREIAFGVDVLVFPCPLPTKRGRGQGAQRQGEG